MAIIGGTAIVMSGLMAVGHARHARVWFGFRDTGIAVLEVISGSKGTGVKPGLTGRKTLNASESEAFSLPVLALLCASGNFGSLCLGISSKTPGDTAHIPRGKDQTEDKYTPAASPFWRYV
jgi:hypothetical protein